VPSRPLLIIMQKRLMRHATKTTLFRAIASSPQVGIRRPPIWGCALAPRVRETVTRASRVMDAVARKLNRGPILEATTPAAVWPMRLPIISTAWKNPMALPRLSAENRPLT